MTQPIRFGPFEADPQAGELRKNGRRVRLQDQPFRILALLLEHPGEVVSREELREKLWPADTFVEFEHSLNTAVNRLRAALGDSAGKPRYIETVPRRGYRFVGRTGELAGNAETLPAATPDSKRVRIPWPVAILALALVGSIALNVWLSTRAGTADLPLRRFTIPTGEAEVRTAVISPDGRHVVVAGPFGVPWVHDLDTGRRRVLQVGDNFRVPFWSPTSDVIGFVRGAGAITKVPARGGPEVKIGAVVGTGNTSGAWDAGGQSIFVASGSLFEVSSNGSDPETVLGGEDLFWHPSPLPGKGKLLMISGLPGDAEILALDLRRRRRQVIAKGARPVWSPTGHVVYERPGSDRSRRQTELWARAFSAATLQPAGDSFPVREGARRPSISNDGTLVYLSGGVGLRQLVWRDRRGDEIGLIGQPQPLILMPVLSPDGERVAALAGWEFENPDIWIYEVSRPQARRVTVDPFHVDRPCWTPDGKAIAYTSFGGGEPKILVRAADGSGDAEVLAPGRNFGHGWTKDSRYFVYEELATGRGSDLWYLHRKDAGADYESVPLIADEFDTLAPQISPDGRFLAYSSNKTGEYEIYVQPFPEGRAAVLVSSGGGLAPRWRRDGRELFYLAPGDPRTLMTVQVTTTPKFTFGTAKRLFSDAGFRGRAQTYDVSADGQRIVMVKTIEAPEKTEIHVVQNWYAEFRDRHTRH